jgi:hypothetical protein
LYVVYYRVATSNGMIVMLNFFRALYDSEAIMIIRFKL